MKEKILIFGNGQMGNFHNDYFKINKVESKIAEGVDITDKKQVEKVVKEYNPTTVINTAAKTNLEWCSDNKLETYNVNVLGADNIAQVCDDEGVYFIHYSSGCIFQSKDAKDEKFEDDTPNPAAYYAWTKVWAEQMIPFEKSENFKYLILRPRQPVSAQVNYKNTLMKMLTFSKFIDTPNTQTVIEDLMDWTMIFLEKRPVGVLHVANEGWTTPYEIGVLLKKYVLPSMEFEMISKEELDKMMPNTRVDTTLNVDKLKSIVGEDNLTPISKRLETLIKEFAENIKEADAELMKEQIDKTMAQSKARTVCNTAWEDLLK